MGTVETIRDDREITLVTQDTDVEEIKSLFGKKALKDFNAFFIKEYEGSIIGLMGIYTNVPNLDAPLYKIEWE